jgi:hypothetical protein
MAVHHVEMEAVDVRQNGAELIADPPEVRGQYRR